MLGWIKNRKRKSLIADEFPLSWRRVLSANVPQFALLDHTMRSRLEDDLRIFMAEKDWEGAGGLEVSEEIKLIVSARAGLLTLALEHDYYPNVQSIIVYPSGYGAPARRYRPGGVVTETIEERLGEAHGIGPVVLSWRDAAESEQDAADGRNVVFHEFAHKLDFVDGSADGVPHLYSSEQYEQWAAVMSAEFEELRRADWRGEDTVLDPYGAAEPAEFFAVATECFFEQPVQLRLARPALYLVLKEYFRQDPAQWPGRNFDPSLRSGPAPVV